MDTAAKIRKFLAKLQNLPEQKKKIILWTIVAILAIVMGFFWIRGAMNNLSKISGEVQNIKIPQVDIPNIPNLNLQNTGDQNSIPNTLNKK